MIKTILKKILWIIVIFVALDVGVVIALPHFVSTEKVAGFVQEQVREKTGRDLAFTDAHFVFWPNLGLELKQVTFSNPAWAQQKNMVSLGKADVALELAPLLEHHIVIKKFVLNEPEIYLEIGTDGKQNWDFSEEPVAAATAPAAPEPQHRKSVEAPMAQGFDVQFGQIQISKGKLIFADLQKKTTDSVEDVNINVNWRDPKSPLQVKGDLVYKAKRIDLDLDLDKPLDFFEGRSSSGQVAVKSDAFTIKASGALAQQGTLMKGDMDVSVPSLSNTLAWASGEKEPKNLPFEKLSFTGEAHVTRNDIILKNSTLALDDVQARGGVHVGFAGKPEIFARMAVNKLNLDRFTGGNSAAASGGKNAGRGESGQSSGGGENGWDTTPIDFAGLRALNADLQLQTQGFTLRGIDVGPSLLTVQLQNGDLRFKSSEASLLGGKFSSAMDVNAAAAPTMALTFDMAGVQAQPVLATFAHFKKLSGTATAHAALTAAGNNQKEIISSLGGNGNFDFKNGELQGLDLVKIAQLIQSHSTNMGVNDGETKFVDLTGTFTASKGILSNTDMKMKGPAIQATGKGIVDLPRKYIQYTATPVLVTSNAQGAAPALSVPVNIKGPFSDIRVIPDFASTVRDILKNPSGARTTIKNLRENLRQNPGAAVLNNILGGKLLGKPAPEVAPTPEAAPAPQPQPQPQPETQPQPAP